MRACPHASASNVRRPQIRRALHRRRAAGARSFVTLHVLVPAPARWSVARGHEMGHQVESAIRAALPGISALTHVEPLGRSHQDMDR